MIKRNDFILIGAVILLCAMVLIFVSLTKKEGSKVVITVDGKVYDTLSLDKDITFTVKGANGEYNTFTIKNGYVDMVEANCPDKLCVKQKAIHYNNETIVCLPNKVVLQIKGGEENDVDVIAN